MARTALWRMLKRAWVGWEAWDAASSLWQKVPAWIRRKVAAALEHWVLLVLTFLSSVGTVILQRVAGLPLWVQYLGFIATATFILWGFVAVGALRDRSRARKSGKQVRQRSLRLQLEPLDIVEGATHEALLSIKNVGETCILTASIDFLHFSPESPHDANALRQKAQWKDDAYLDDVRLEHGEHAYLIVASAMTVADDGFANPRTRLEFPAPRNSRQYTRVISGWMPPEEEDEVLSVGLRLILHGKGLGVAFERDYTLSVGSGSSLVFRETPADDGKSRDS